MFLVYDSVDSEASMAAAMTRTASASGSSIMTCDMLDSPMGSPGERVIVQLYYQFRNNTIIFDIL